MVGLVAILVLAAASAFGLAFYSLNAPAHVFSGLPATAVPTSTATPTIMFSDPLTSNAYGWSSDQHCFFRADGYHIRNGWMCYAPAGEFTDSVVTVQAKEISGGTGYPYGIVFRVQAPGNYYNFMVYGDQHWAFWVCLKGKCSQATGFVYNAALHPGHNAVNTFTVKIQGSHFTFSANGTVLGNAKDNSIAQGRTGLVAGDNLEAVFTHFLITTVS